MTDGDSNGETDGDSQGEADDDSLQGIGGSRREPDPTIRPPDVDFDPVIDALLDAYELKDERRTGWQLRGVVDPESVAAHSWGVAYLVLVLGDRFRGDLPGVDLDRALRIAVVHDVAEAKTGDVATRVNDMSAGGSDRKERIERAAMADLADPVPDRVRDAWEEYEARRSPEAILVKECDLLDTCVQAIRYERYNRYDTSAGNPDAFDDFDALEEFFATTEARLRTRAGRALFERLHDRYRTER